MKKINLSIIFIFLLSSCSTKPTEEDSLINIIFKNHVCIKTSNKSEKHVYIINATYYDGCHTCIEKVKEFCKQNKSQKNLSVIISTKLKRNMRIEYTKDELSSACIDTTGIFVSNTETVGTLPVILMYEGDNLMKKINVNPTNIDTCFVSIKKWILNTN